MHYVIIGAGPAGVIAAETLRKTDRDSQITLLGDESGMPYSRMAIPYFIADEINAGGTHLRKEDHYAKHGLEFRNERVAYIGTQDKTLDLESGSQLPYDRLLLATGSRPITLPIPGVELPGVHPCWTLDQARQIRELARPGARVVLIGAGFIGCIVMGALLGRGATLTVLEREGQMLPRTMDETGAGMIKRWCAEKGVTVRTATRVTGIERGGYTPNSRARLSTGLTVHTETGEPLVADLVVLAAGVRPNLDIISGTGIHVRDGILVDEYLRTSQPDIYAAGDVAQGKDWSTGERMVHAIQPTAVEHGRVGALNMAGVPTVYPGSLSMNVLDTMGLVSTSLGLWDEEEWRNRGILMDRDRYRYIRLAFYEDRLVGALTIGEMAGWTGTSGVLRGLIQSKTPLGKWKQRLRSDPTRVMEAYHFLTTAGGGAR
uniref:Pyridine nucleotide-disulphide oxidoreductase n=1 Tax=Candidatus Kentrum eta TaxID=2126337 RepID=A0A450UGY2_9GAMM|nr:MAG: Pyridine nucleotide-disulphide oxidoreductase [Candidatus Kentron sp. H]VFJ91779.1 MAG: Pyridine nucleotide-disulphide oxidoreductase [Candidatus Kentron sp. H]VFJ98409.1 MAG: Pyridine nucleotide-disulphide oxidoreductase [Candidatus Kentron sp. H]